MCGGKSVSSIEVLGAKDILLQQFSIHRLHTCESPFLTHVQSHAHTLPSHQKSQAQVNVCLHAAAGGNLVPISEPSDLWPGEAVYPWCIDESTLTLGYSLRSFTLHKTTHI